MPFLETKVYFDGSHYIAIPRSFRPVRRKRKPKIEEQNKAINDEETDMNTDIEMQEKASEKAEKPDGEKKTAGVLLENKGTPIPHEINAPEDSKIEKERKKKNMIARRTRCLHKAQLQDFNYFVTLTYDDKLHSEVSFKKKLRTCLAHLCLRKDWKYIGVWERSPEKNRLHFHGLFAIPENAMPGLLFEKSDYNLNTHKMQTTVQNTYFNDKYGRSDFEPIDDRNGLYDALAYILKYIEKTGERIVYSKGLPQFFISDIMDGDVVCKIGWEDKKLLLFDGFTCIDEGELLGQVNRETIKGMRGAN